MNMSMSSNSSDDYSYHSPPAAVSFIAYFFLPILSLNLLITICIAFRKCYLAYTRRRQQTAAPIQVAVHRLRTTRTSEISTCAICLEDDGDVERVLTQCGHVFHRRCLHQWLTTDHATCPVCRASAVAPPLASAVN